MNAFEQWIDNNKGEIPDIVYSALSELADYLDGFELYTWESGWESDPEKFSVHVVLADLMKGMARTEVFKKLADAEYVSIGGKLYQRVFVHSAYHDAGAKDAVLVYINGADVITVTRADISMAIVNGYDITVGHTVINI